MRGTCRAALLAVLLLSAGVAACEQSARPGPMERTGTYIDRKVTDAQHGVAEFSQRAGQSLDGASRSVGAGAQRAGAAVHDRLMPTGGDKPTPPDGWAASANRGYPSGAPPQPGPMGP